MSLASIPACATATVHGSVGAVHAPTSDARSGVAVGGGLGFGDEVGMALGASNHIVIAQGLGVMAPRYDLIALSPRFDRWRALLRFGLGGWMGWVDGDFDGGLHASAEIGVAIGNETCAPAIHASAWYLAERPMLGVHLSLGCFWRKDDTASQRSNR